MHATAAVADADEAAGGLSAAGVQDGGDDTRIHLPAADRAQLARLRTSEVDTSKRAPLCLQSMPSAMMMAGVSVCWPLVGMQGVCWASLAGM